MEKNLLSRYNAIVKKNTFLERKRQAQEENLKNLRKASGYKSVADRNQHHIKEEKIKPKINTNEIKLIVTLVDPNNANRNIYVDIGSIQPYYHLPKGLL